MGATQSTPFRFLDLPRELRNNVYEFAVGTVDPLPSRTGPHDFRPCMLPQRRKLERATHAINTRLLRICKQVYYEAYEVMVKKNQFIKVRCLGLNMLEVLRPCRVPVVTMDRSCVRQFKGYTAEVKLTNPYWVLSATEYENLPQLDLMILGRDWEAFCVMLAWIEPFLKPDALRCDLQLHVHINPPPRKLFGQKALKHQHALLEPLSANLLGLDQAHFCGRVDPNLASRTRATVCKSLNDDPSYFFQRWQAQSAAADSFLETGQYAPAIEEATKTLLHMDCTVGYTSFAVRNSHIFDENFNRNFWNLYNGVSICSLEARIRAIQAFGREAAKVFTLEKQAGRDCYQYQFLFNQYKSYLPPTHYLPLYSQVSKYFIKVAQFYCLNDNYISARNFSKAALSWAPQDAMIRALHDRITEECEPKDRRKCAMKPATCALSRIPYN